LAAAARLGVLAESVLAFEPLLVEGALALASWLLIRSRIRSPHPAPAPIWLRKVARTLVTGTRCVTSVALLLPATTSTRVPLTHLS
jgi:hypothetical protein